MHLWSTSKDSIDGVEKSSFHECIEYFLTEVIFYILDKQAVKILLGTSFIDGNIAGILPQLRKVVTCSSKPVSTVAPKTTKGDVVVRWETASQATPARVTSTEMEEEMPVTKLIRLKPKDIERVKVYPKEREKSILHRHKLSFDRDT